MCLCIGNTQLQTNIKHAFIGEPYDCGEGAEIFFLLVDIITPLQPTLSSFGRTLWETL